MFRRFFEEGLAQSSYLLACDRTRRAVVIDPRRDIAGYVAAAREADLTITHAIDTHVHADFVSGARELAAIGAEIVAGPATISAPSAASSRAPETKSAWTWVSMAWVIVRPASRAAAT